MDVGYDTNFSSKGPTGSGPGLMVALIKILFSSRTNRHWWVAKCACKEASKMWNSFLPISFLFHTKVGSYLRFSIKVDSFLSCNVNKVILRK
jgi:hypothetical protein